MKILDPGNAGARIKAFLLWGVLLFVVQYGSGLLLTSTPNGIIIIIAVTLLFSVFAGYMTANSLKNNTGDKRSSAIYGAVVPIFATLIGWVVALVTGAPLHFSLPLLPMLAGLVGGYLSQRRF